MRGLGTRIGAAAGLLALFVVASPSGPATASAADEPLMLSTDGLSWSASLQDALFDGGVTLIPGGSYDDVLWVMSSVSGRHLLTASLCDGSASSMAFGDKVTVGATTPFAPGSAAATLNQSGSTCALILPELQLDAGVALPITLTLAMSESASTADTLDARAGFSVGLTLSEIVPGSPSASAPIAGVTSATGEGTGVTVGGARPSRGPSRDADHGELTTPYTVRLPDGLGEIDTRAIPAEIDPDAYSEAGSGDLPLEPTLWGALAISLGVLAGVFFLILARRRRREEDEDEAAPAR